MTSCKRLLKCWSLSRSLSSLLCFFYFTVASGLLEMAAFKYVALAAVLALFSISTSAQAQNDSTPTPEASTFYLEKTETQFSINIANDSSGVYLYFASPAYSWVGVGFGAQMENSLMLIMYPDADGNSTSHLVSTTV